ncbi:MAG: cupin domain-containing protein [Hyphomicrobiaceae bacterium]
MTAMTPNYEFDAKLGPLQSRLVDVDKLAWAPTPYKGIEIKVLMTDPATGMMTALFRWQPGSVLPDHEHIDLEQTWILEGSLVDEDGVVTAGNFVWRPAGSRHNARAPNGALVLSMFLKPNRFFE